MTETETVYKKNKKKTERLERAVLTEEEEAEWRSV